MTASNYLILVLVVAWMAGIALVWLTADDDEGDDEWHD